MIIGIVQPVISYKMPLKKKKYIRYFPLQTTVWQIFKQKVKKSTHSKEIAGSDGGLAGPGFLQKSPLSFQDTPLSFRNYIKIVAQWKGKKSPEPKLTSSAPTCPEVHIAKSVLYPYSIKRRMDSLDKR